MSAIFEIEKQQKEYKKGSVGYLTAELLKCMCNDSVIDEIIAQDLPKPDMNIKAIVKKMQEYAMKNRQDDGYGMGDDVAREIIGEMFGLQNAENAGAESKEEPKKKSEMVDLNDFL